MLTTTAPPPRIPWTLTEKLSLAFLLVAFVALVWTVHLVWLAYVDEKAHADFLFDCTHWQRSEDCENRWLGQHGVKP